MKHGFVIALVVIVGFVLITNAYGFYMKEYVNKPFVQEKVVERDYSYLYDFYLSATPSLVGQPYVGGAGAPITIIAYMSPSSDSSRFFFSDVFPVLEADYVGQGKVRLFYKPYVTLDDIDQKNDNFIKSAFLDCAGELNPEEYHAVWERAVYLSASGLGILVDEFSMPREEFKACIDKADFPGLTETALEIENFGMLGIEPRFYVGLNGRDNTVVDGIPSIARFKRTVRNYQLIIGD